MLFWHQTRTQTKMEDGESVVVKTARYDGTSQPTNGLMGAEWREYPANKYPESMASSRGGALGYFFGGYVPPGTPNWHPVLEKFSPKIDTPL